MTDTYASNFSDSGYYIGACPDCNAVINRAHSEYNALGYSGTNSGGHLLIENSEWDNNKTGFVSNSQNSADPPSPQNGACPGTADRPDRDAFLLGVHQQLRARQQQPERSRHR